MFRRHHRCEPRARAGGRIRGCEGICRRSHWQNREVRSDEIVVLSTANPDPPAGGPHIPQAISACHATPASYLITPCLLPLPLPLREIVRALVARGVKVRALARDPTAAASVQGPPTKDSSSPAAWHCYSHIVDVAVDFKCMCIVDGLRRTSPDPRKESRLSR